VKAWIFGIARNRARKFRGRHGRPRPPLQLVHGASAVAPDEAMQWRRAAVVVEHFLETLDDDKRAVFVLADLEGMTAPEVAAATGTKLNTVYSRLRAARGLFAKVVARAQAQRRRSGEPA
jgi:RNA polymerase sigma-70 factor (ECF subfamily)